MGSAVGGVSDADFAALHKTLPRDNPISGPHTLPTTNPGRANSGRQGHGSLVRASDAKETARREGRIVASTSQGDNAEALPRFACSPCLICKTYKAGTFRPVGATRLPRPNRRSRNIEFSRRSREKADATRDVAPAWPRSRSLWHAECFSASRRHASSGRQSTASVASGPEARRRQLIGCES